MKRLAGVTGGQCNQKKTLVCLSLPTQADQTQFDGFYERPVNLKLGHN